MTQALPARRPARRQGRTGRTESGGRYGLLLMLLIVIYLLSAFNVTTLASGVQIGLFAVILLLALRTSPLPWHWATLVGAITVIGSAAAYGAALTGTETSRGAGEIGKGLILLLAAVLIVRGILAKPTVTIRASTAR